MLYTEKPAFIINICTFDMMHFGEWNDLAQLLFYCMPLGGVLVEAPTDEVILKKMMDDDIYFKAYYLNYFKQFFKGRKDRNIDLGE